MSKPPAKVDPPRNLPIDELEQQIVRRNPRVFDGVSDNKKREILRAFSIEYFYSGPIPDPVSLAKYNDIIPNGADRIMKMAENQNEHRIKIEDKAITSQLKQSERGQVFGFIIALCGLGGAFFLGATGHETAASIIGGGSLVGLVSVFVFGKWAQRRNLERKK